MRLVSAGLGGYVHHPEGPGLPRYPGHAQIALFGINLLYFSNIDRMKAAARAVMIPGGEHLRVNEILRKHFAFEQFAAYKCQTGLGESHLATFQRYRMEASLGNLVTVPS